MPARLQGKSQEGGRFSKTRRSSGKKEEVRLQRERGGPVADPRRQGARDGSLATAHGRVIDR